MSFSAGRVYAEDHFAGVTAMDKLVSRDGTVIAFDSIGHGPPIVFVVGAFNDRSTGAALAAALAGRFTVLCYDRRGRGDSGDTPPSAAAPGHAIEREIDDIAALIARAGGAAGLFGFSSGAVLALTAAAHGLPVTRLALYDLPLFSDGPHGQARRAAAASADHVAALSGLIARGRRGDAVEYFQRVVVGIPEPVVAQLRRAPFRPALEAMAHTLISDVSLVGDGTLDPALARRVRVPALAIAGGAAFPFMRETAEAIAGMLPDGASLILDGAGHDLAPAALAPALERFFG